MTGRDDSRQDCRQRAPKRPKPAPPPARPDENQALTAQNRKLLGKHYGNKYRTNRRGG